MANMITKSDASALIPEQVMEEIFKEAQKYSKVLQLFRRLPNMTSDKMRLKVMDSLPVAYWVTETTNNGRKNTTKMAWKDVYLTAEELAVIVPIKENLLLDAKPAINIPTTGIIAIARYKTKLTEKFINTNSDEYGIIPHKIITGTKTKTGAQLYKKLS